MRISVQSKADADRRRRRERQAAEVQKRDDGIAARLEPDVIPMLCQEIDRLPEKYRAPVVLCHIEELTHEAAAQVLRCPIGTVHGRLSRARELLRRRLVRRGVALPAGLAAIQQGAESLAAAVPDALRRSTIRAAVNLAVGRGISAAAGSATVGTLVLATIRSMAVGAIKTAGAIVLVIGVAVGATVLAGKGPAGMLATADESSSRRDAEAIQGVWAVTAIEQVNHQPSDEEKAFLKTGQFTITITADRLTFDPDKSSMNYRLVTSTTPRRMLWTKTDDPASKVVAIAFYALDGDDLKICVGRGEPGRELQPPHGFDIKSAPPGTFPTLFVMKRQRGSVQGDLEQAPRIQSLLPAKFDKPSEPRILPEANDEPLFVDLDTGHFLSPPFDLEPLERDRPTALPNLAFPQKLKDWVRLHGIDAAVQTDGRSITLLGLETEVGQLPPKPDTWKVLTPADALRLIEPFPDQSRRPVVGRWPRFARTFRQEELPITLPFLTREGSLGILELRWIAPTPRIRKASVGATGSQALGSRVGVIWFQGGRAVDRRAGGSWTIPRAPSACKSGRGASS